VSGAKTPFPARASPVRVLVVDDFELWRQFVCSTLETQPELQVVGQVADGWEAVQKARELKADLILLDVSLPRLNGIDASIRIRQVAPGAKILFLTQINDPDIIRAALSNGAQGYILKTDGESELLSGIRAIARGERFVSSGIKLDDYGLA
jgi:two-component system nitrate/nitrite response regulator NarL